jgi:hypothetical protein
MHSFVILGVLAVLGVLGGATAFSRFIVHRSRQLDAKLSEERLFCHSRAGGNPEVFYFPVSVFLGFRLRGSDEPYCINLLAWMIHEPRMVADTLSGTFIVFMNNAG